MNRGEVFSEMLKDPIPGQILREAGRAMAADLAKVCMTELLIPRCHKCGWTGTPTPVTGFALLRHICPVAS